MGNRPPADSRPAVATVVVTATSSCALTAASSQERLRLATRGLAPPLMALHNHRQGLERGQRVTVSSLYTSVAITGCREPSSSLLAVLAEKATRGLGRSWVVAGLGD
ncbi:hypothetical protein CRG98_034096 [Punica granatum]|uniref:Uncharacterized protein n=1 Tax=Punica granatum TaxID=22663 RepID=A0A2I0IND6_PUNGR|nr:hypothetical protein CRG98_034096 [Punica granatum]